MIVVHGHRGARAIKPENTIVAFEEALRLGVDVLEMDIGITKDRVAILSHDRFINQDICQYEDGKRVTEKIPIFSLTLKEVKKFDCGSIRNPKFPKQITSPKEKIPTLDEVFNYVKNSKWPVAAKVEFNIETKIEDDRSDLGPLPDEFAKIVIGVINKHGMLSRTILQSFDYRTLRVARKEVPTLRLSALVEGFFSNMIKVARVEKPDIVSPDFTLLSQSKVSELHKMGIQVVPWTLNAESEWRKAVEWGVDGIISDDPGALISFLVKNKLRQQ